MPEALDPQEKFLPNPKLKLREQVGEVMRFKHFSHRTESAYWHWIKGFILFHQKRHPRELGAKEVQAYLSHLASERNVATATQNQALNAIVFLYRAVLNVDLGNLGKIERPTRRPKLPTVLTKDEVRQVLAAVSPEHPSFVCNASLGEWLRHPHGAGFTRAQGRGDDADLHARDAKAWDRGEKSVGYVNALFLLSLVA